MAEPRYCPLHGAGHSSLERLDHVLAGCELCHRAGATEDILAADCDLHCSSRSSFPADIAARTPGRTSPAFALGRNGYDGIDEVVLTAMVALVAVVAWFALGAVVALVVVADLSAVVAVVVAVALCAVVFLINQRQSSSGA